MTQTLTAADRLAQAQDYVSGAEGIWIDEEVWRERASYERDTNAWVNDPYDQVSSAEIAADGTALQHALSAVGPATVHDDAAQIAELATEGVSFADELVRTGGNPRGAGGYSISTPDLADRLHHWWTQLEDLWTWRIRQE